MNSALYKNKIRNTDDESLEVDGLPDGDYDKQAVKYDKLISNSLYNKIMWGNSPEDYTEFAKEGNHK